MKTKNNIGWKLFKASLWLIKALTNKISGFVYGFLFFMYITLSNKSFCFSSEKITSIAISVVIFIIVYELIYKFILKNLKESLHKDIDYVICEINKKGLN